MQYLSIPAIDNLKLMFNNEEIFMDYFIEKNILYGKRRC
jgi:hypothetical protein